MGTYEWYFLPAATKLGQGNVFKGVCLSTGGEGVCLSACWDARPPWTRHTPPGPGTPPPGSRPPRPDPPSLDSPPPDQAPPSRLQHTVYEWPVRILLECILVHSMNAGAVVGIP